MRVANIDKGRKASRKPSPGKAGYPISLAPLTFKDALKGMLEVAPQEKQPKKAKKKPATRRAKGNR